MDPELTAAFSHPIRWEILECLQGRVASPVEISEQIGASQRAVSYHAGTLLRHGYLELVHREARQGGVENFFAISPRCVLNRGG